MKIKVVEELKLRQGQMREANKKKKNERKKKKNSYYNQVRWSSVQETNDPWYKVDIINSDNCLIIYGKGQFLQNCHRSPIWLLLLLQQQQPLALLSLLLL